MVPRGLIQVLDPPQKFEVSYFGMVEGTELKVRRLGHLKWHEYPAGFHENLPSGSKIISEGQTAW
jgi:hypothetical protein